MDCIKVGKLIRQLRIEKKLTQKELADEMNLSDKTVSKWERGIGLPDVSLLTELSEILEISIERLLCGDLSESELAGGNMKKSKYYVCPVCGNFTISTGDVEISCCGRKLTEETLKKADEIQKLTVTDMGDELYITSSHPMKKDNYVSFVAMAVGGGLQIVKLYPEWDLQCNISKWKHGMLLWYSTTEGMFYQYV